MNMRKFNKLLNKNLKIQTPDLLDKIIDENSYRLNPAPKPVLRNKKFLSLAAGFCCLIIIFVSIYAVKSLYFGNDINSPSEIANKNSDSQKDSSGPDNGSSAVNPGVGGKSGDSYSLGTFQIDCSIPSNKTLYSYKLLGNNSIGNFTEILSSLFNFKITGSDDEKAKFSTDNQNIILFGDIETGLFSYQNNRNNQQEIAKYGNDPSIKDKTYQQALHIVNTLKPIIGDVRLKDSEVQKTEVAAVGNEKAYTSTSYIYIFEPHVRRTVDGFANSSDLRITFDADGFVFSINNQISSASLNRDTQITLFDVSDYFKNHVTYEVKDANVILTKWDIQYVASPSFDGTSEMVPYVDYEYSVNGEKLSGQMALNISFD